LSSVELRSALQKKDETASKAEFEGW